MPSGERPVERRRALAQRLRLIPGRRPILRALGRRRRHIEQRLCRHDLGHPGLIGRIIAGHPPLGARLQHARRAAAAAPGARSGAWRGAPSARDRETAGTADRGSHPAAAGSAPAHRRSTDAGCRGSGAVASPPSGTRRDSREQMPFSNTSQAISPASGCAAICARACSPLPNPTSSHSLDRTSGEGGERIARLRRGKARRGRVTWSSRSCRGRSRWPRPRP